MWFGVTCSLLIRCDLLVVAIACGFGLMLGLVCCYVCDFGYFGLRFVGFAVLRFVVLSLCDSLCCCYEVVFCWFDGCLW